MVASKEVADTTLSEWIVFAPESVAEHDLVFPRFNPDLDHRCGVGLLCVVGGLEGVGQVAFLFDGIERLHSLEILLSFLLFEDGGVVRGQ